jgi:HK97 gp10 family phage protein
MITIKLKGFDKTIKDVQKLATDANKNAKTALVLFGKNVETQAKRDAPADEGKLKASINAVFDNATFTEKITVATDYAAYQEFGTRKFAAAYVGTLPQEWRTYAATFKGKGGGTFEEFVKSLTEWARKTGHIPVEAAYVTALKILREGLKPRKFLYEAVKDNLPKLQSDFNKIFS